MNSKQHVTISSKILKDYELQFKGMPNSAYATITQKDGASVPVAVWKIKPLDEKSLDRYEGYPSHYYKQDVSVQIGNKSVDAMVYIMNHKMTFGLPSVGYYQTVLEGYHDCRLDVTALNEALGRSAVKFYEERTPDYLMEVEADDDLDEYDDLDGDDSLNADEAIDEDDPEEEDIFRMGL